MSTESALLQNEPEVFSACPNCGASPFKSVLRGGIKRSKYTFWTIERRPYCAVICSEPDCWDIVGWENPPCNISYDWKRAWSVSSIFGLTTVALLSIIGWMSLLTGRTDNNELCCIGLAMQLGACILFKVLITEMKSKALVLEPQVKRICRAMVTRVEDD